MVTEWGCIGEWHAADALLESLVSFAGNHRVPGQTADAQRDLPMVCLFAYLFL